MDHDTVITCLAIGVFPVMFVIGMARRSRRKTSARRSRPRQAAAAIGLRKTRSAYATCFDRFASRAQAAAEKARRVALQLARALLADRRIVFHIVASKPEDREWWQQRFAEAKRANELRIVAPDSGMRYNMLDAELKAGADDREIASILMTSGETLRRTDATVGGGGENDQFFRDQSERMVEMAVLPLRLATGTVRASDLQRFISGAAMSPEQLKEPEWRQGFHWKTLEAALNAPKTEIEKADMEQCTDYWLGQIPTLNDRTKTSIMVQVQGILHVMGSGVVRNLISSDTTLSPAMMDDGVSILVDMPGSRYGASGQFVNAVWRLGRATPRPAAARERPATGSSSSGSTNFRITRFQGTRGTWRNAVHIWAVRSF